MDDAHRLFLMSKVVELGSILAVGARYLTPYGGHGFWSASPEINDKGALTKQESRVKAEKVIAVSKSPDALDQLTNWIYLESQRDIDAMYLTDCGHDLAEIGNLIMVGDLQGAASRLTQRCDFFSKMEEIVVSRGSPIEAKIWQQSAELARSISLQIKHD